MRIQHNIMAMNAYRNYSNNTSALSKNLEKLSSGYKINRAGDDAAGLAISEKMRAQITGLDVAQKNAKDGVSLVQTAEGALTEVHDMLNRMVELASQSANGTYDSTDRTQLQKEVSQLRDEIDRIADSANFNGIKLLDGSLEENGMKTVDISGLGAATTTAAGPASIGAATGKSIMGSIDTAGEKITVSFSTDDGSAYSVSLSMKDANTLVDEATGKEYSYATATSSADITSALNATLSNATGGAFTASVNADGELTITSDAKGAGAPNFSSLTVIDKDGAGVDLGALTKTDASPEEINIANGNYTVVTSGTTATASNVFSINGQKFAILADDTALEASKEELGDEVNILIGSDLEHVAGQLAQATGLDIKAVNTTGIKISTSSGSALTLQIGDTSDDFNQLEVKVGDMHANALGIGGINIGTQDGAAAAISSIKAAINKVSDVRGTLGATQNRLDHTMNNLSVMQENIQDAESAIRDTDVADEMMEYTKNNILIQSAQAMLAQANQVPQGVLQLLQ